MFRSLLKCVDYLTDEHGGRGDASDVWHQRRIRHRGLQRGTQPSVSSAFQYPIPLNTMIEPVKIAPPMLVGVQVSGSKSDSMNTGESSQLGKHAFGSLHNLTWSCYQNEGILLRHWFRFTNEVDYTSLNSLLRLSYYAGCQELSRCHTRGESKKAIPHMEWNIQVRHPA